MKMHYMGGKPVHGNPLPFPSSHPSTNPFQAGMLGVHKTSPYEYLMYNSCNANPTLFYFSLCPVHYFAQVLRQISGLTGGRPKASRTHTHTHHCRFNHYQRRDLSVQIHKGVNIDFMHALALFELADC